MTFTVAIATARRASRRLRAHEFVRLTSTSAIMVAMQVAGTGLTFGFTFILARLLPAAEVGLVWTVWSAALLVSVFASLNIGNAAIREVVRAATLGDRARVAGFLRVSRVAIAALAMPCGAAFVLGFYLFDRATFTAYGPLVVLAAAVLPVVALERTQGALAAALGHPVAGKMPGLFVRPLAIASVLAAISLTPLGVGAGLALSIMLGAVVLAATLQTVMLRPAFAPYAAVRPHTGDWRRWLGAGAILIPSRTFADNLKNLCVVAAALLLSDGDVARFAIAFSLIVFLNFGIMAVDVVFDPKISGAISAQNAARRDTMLGFAGFLKLGPVLVAACALWVFGRDILALFGETYVAAATALHFLVLMPVARVLAGSAIMVLQVSGERMAVAAVSLAAIVLVAGAIIAGSALGGLTAAAAAGSLAYCGAQAMLHGVCRARTGVNPSPLPFLLARCTPWGMRRP